MLNNNFYVKIELIFKSLINKTIFLMRQMFTDKLVSVNKIFKTTIRHNYENNNYNKYVCYFSILPSLCTSGIIASPS